MRFTLSKPRPKAHFGSFQQPYRACNKNNKNKKKNSTTPATTDLVFSPIHVARRGHVTRVDELTRKIQRIKV